MLKAAISDALQVRFTEEGATGEDVAAAFKETIIAAIADAVVEGFIEGFIRAALAEGPIAEALADIQDLINQYIKGDISLEDFSTKLKTAMGDVGPEIDRIADALGIASDVLVDLLHNAGILPDKFSAAADSAQDLVDKITDLNNQIEDLMQKRIDIRINLLGDLERIGAVPRGTSARARISALRPGIDDLLSGRPLTPIGTRSGIQALTDRQLEQAIANVQDYRDAVLDLYDAQAQEVQDNLNATIDAIHKEFDARREAIENTIEGLQD